ncbi:DNA internalization-related competence protein ComEC/Rec2 [Oceanimonas pelagia]|uniref:DNA internalization-related competence protein ComEC/Rec2 n=1 Tax=Oceanimonas pelagia TaxID=3028314 RepID=A0AA50Q8V1_9GAMM|nr:DNA internalization-related competence protein ComEC/Rec2 [Oceanimonas pelagia]WMC12370.1 DNA internalization-related competence protein ComEC/Rec2 [Oceanimonas pelagia]
MDKRLFFFCAGVTSTLIWPWLPARDPWLLPVIIGVVCWRSRPALAGFLLGFVWVLCFSHWHLAWLKTPGMGERSQLITASVVEVQPRLDGASRLIVGLSHLDGQALLPRPRVLLSWYGPEPGLQKGDSFSAITRLYPPHALVNPGSFNSARWLLGQGITARGYITGTLTHRQVAPAGRATLLARFDEATRGLGARPWLRALGFGERGGLSQQDWTMLRALGVSHLFAISGLHIGLVAGLGWLAGRFSGHHWAGVLAALILASGYAWLAGFGVATQRALLMLVLWLGGLWWGRFWSGRRILLLTMTLLLLFNPWLVLNQGFWLSVLAVAALLWLAGGRVRPGLLRLQLGLGMLLLPPVLLWFGGLSWLSVPVNLVLIPLFSLLLIPLLLLACALLLMGPAAAAPVFWLLNALFMPLMTALHGLAEQFSPWTELSAVAQGVIVLGLLLPLFMALPAARWLGLALGWLAVLTLWPGPAWQVRVLDVGQGLSVLVTQGSRALLYDTGNRFPSGFNMADGVILPLLARLGIDELDYLVVSHEDSDHSANRDYLATRVPVRHRWGAWPRGMPCRAGQQRQWGRLRLEMLWPEALTGHRNNDSCVLRISDGRLSVLLTGDIEAKAEQALLVRNAALEAGLLLSPHHGSRSSSSAGLIAAVAPQWVVHTAGFANRWGFPAPAVVARYRRAGAEQLITGEQGMIQLAANGTRWRRVGHGRPGPWYQRLVAWRETGGTPAKPLE